MPSIGIFVYDCADELDIVGPWEVLTAWQFISSPSKPCEPLNRDRVEVFTFALPDPKTGGKDRVVRCAKGLRIVPDYLWGSPDLPKIEVLIYPGGPDMSPHQRGSRYEAVARAAADQGALVVGVCVGAIALARYGLLRSKPATTHWLAIDQLRDIDGTIRIVPNRVVDAGEVITTSGISASIDGALYLVARLDSPDRAREVRRYVEYDPAPPVSLLGNPSREHPKTPWVVDGKPKHCGHPASGEEE